jgi:hypothetical protein
LHEQGERRKELKQRGWPLQRSDEVPDFLECRPLGTQDSSQTLEIKHRNQKTKKIQFASFANLFEMKLRYIINWMNNMTSKEFECFGGSPLIEWRKIQTLMFHLVSKNRATEKLNRSKNLTTGGNTKLSMN